MMSIEKGNDIKKEHFTWRREEIGNSSQNEAIEAALAKELPPRGGMVELMGSRPGLIDRFILNPLIPLGCLATVGYMRGRIAAQFFTVCAMVGGSLLMTSKMDVNVKKQ